MSPEALQSLSKHTEVVTPHFCIGCSDDPVADLGEWHELAELELEGGVVPVREISVDRRWTKATSDSDTGAPDEEGAESSEGKKKGETESGGAPPGGAEPSDAHNSAPPGEVEPSDARNIADNDNAENQFAEEGLGEPIKLKIESTPRPPQGDAHFRPPDVRNTSAEDEEKRLIKVSVGTMVAIVLHNFPEGLATYVAALNNPKVGATFAVAIGLHNIPEGLIVALPLYYATGNRWKAFLWGCFSGISEPIAAVLGWLVLSHVINDQFYAVIFGLVSGIMTMISMKEMIPTAHRYDPQDTVVTNSIFVGMAIMGLALMLFQLDSEIS